jgi:hypothetical protein
MSIRGFALGLLLTLVFVPPHVALAQDPSRIIVSAGAGIQPTTILFRDITRYTVNLEEARAESAYDVEGGMTFDLGVGVRVAGPLTAMMSVNRLNRGTTSANTFSTPHPFFFNQNRQTSAPLGGLNLSETMVHVSAAYVVPTESALQVVVFGGPTFIQFKQEIVQTFGFNETYPYDTLTDVQLTRGTNSDSAIGFNAGVDVAWFFSPNVGVGGQLRFVQAEKRLSIGDGDPFDLSLGGVQFGAGIRFRFGE